MVTAVPVGEDARCRTTREQIALSSSRRRRQEHAGQAVPVSEAQTSGASSDVFDLQKAAPHEWPGLRAWRSKGHDLRLTWAPPDAPSGPLAVAPRDAPSLASAVPPGATPPASLVAAGLQVLRTGRPEDKAAMTHAAWGAYLAGQLPLRDAGAPAMTVGLELLAGEAEGERGALAAEGAAGPGEAGLAGLMPDPPARPERPRLVRPKDIPGHESTPLGLNGYLLHNLAHIELNAIDLAWDTVVRFSHLNLPDQFYEDFARVADDESRHLGWCLQRLAELGHQYGDMDAHDLLWQGCSLSAGDLGARLAVVPMSQEARGLDAGARLVQRLVGWGDTRSAAVVGLIAEEERAHVAVGVTWFVRVCGALELQPGPLYRRWLLHLNPDLLKGPFNHPERARVGLPRDWYDPAAWHTAAPDDTPSMAPPALGANAAGATAVSDIRLKPAGAKRTVAGAMAPALPVPVGTGDRAAGSLAGVPAAGARRPVQPRLEGPQPRLSAQQLAAMAERLAAFLGTEGAAAGQG